MKHEINSHVVYPGHGVGKIVDIISKEILGKIVSFYSISLLDNGIRIMIPVNNANTVGLREIISLREAESVIKILRKPPIKRKKVEWGVQYRSYMEKIKTGNPSDLAEMLRDIYNLKIEKELSFGERKMLDNARSLLIRELALVVNVKSFNNIPCLNMK